MSEGIFSDKSLRERTSEQKWQILQQKLKDMKKAAEFRGGRCLSDTMETGDWTGKLKFRCAFGHEFEASPRLILEGGHWCPHCENKSWNYGERAKVDPFFAQVWNPLHEPDELREYPKVTYRFREQDDSCEK